MESKMAALVPKSTGLTSKQLYRVAEFFDGIGTAQTIPHGLNTKDSYSNFIRTLLKPDHIKLGRISCLLSVIAPFTIHSNKAEKIVSKKVSELVAGFFERVGLHAIIPASCDGRGFYAYLVPGVLEVDQVESGRVSCIISAKPVVTNIYGGLHGGAVAAVTELVSIACARTVVGKDKELFLGEMSMSYLSAAPRNAEVMVDASLVRSGRNLTVIAVEFRLKESGQLAYTSRATFYNLPLAINLILKSPNQKPNFTIHESTHHS
ncbi:hypothetical protein RJ639_045631 [Escallonia herrerae]|uniref:Thioesterase domain-containing protein n=1 Tax=Escallonia herrerae TaxID=1293975 RepID=A0AA88W7G8_9ASTE|nr:hypothetical protein RJ639_045631 [Escallonia herrerae]